MAFDPSTVVNKPDGKLPPEAMRQVTDAQLRLSAVLRARKVAQRACISLVFMGVLTGMFAVVGGQGPSWSGLVMGVWMTAAGIVEFIGAQGTAKLKPKALTMLAVNQLLLGLMFAGFGAWWMLALKMGWNTADVTTAEQIYTSLSNSILAIGTATASPAQIKVAAYTIVYWAYGSIVLFGLLVDAPMALYYFYRRRQLEAYLRETPEWIVQMHSITSGAV